MGKRRSTLSTEHRKEIVSAIHRRMIAELLAVLALLGGITGLSLWGIKKHVENIAIDRIAKQFEEPRISALLESVAKREAKEILEKEVNPEVVRFKSETDKKVMEFGSYLGQLKQRYDSDYKTLSTELAELKKRKEIVQLGDKCVQEASRGALEELERISKSDPDQAIRLAAISEAGRVKMFWATATRLVGRYLTGRHPDGKEKTEADFTTEELTAGLLTAREWQTRALAAQALARRKEKGVPQALMQCIEKDPNLEVVKDAVKAFHAVAGFENPDVFRYEPIRDWWAEHATEVNGKLNESQAKVAK